MEDLVGNYYRQTNRPTDQTNQPTQQLTDQQTDRPGPREFTLTMIVYKD